MTSNTKMEEGRVTYEVVGLSLTSARTVICLINNASFSLLQDNFRDIVTRVQLAAGMYDDLSTNHTK